ncbi:unnamed protein product [Closterium sp. NIES-53]
MGLGRQGKGAGEGEGECQGSLQSTTWRMWVGPALRRECGGVFGFCKCGRPGCSCQHLELSRKDGRGVVPLAATHSFSLPHFSASLPSSHCTILSSCRITLSSCRTTLSSCRTTLSSCRTTLSSCRTTLSSCRTTLSSCHTTLSSCRTTLSSYRTTLSPVPAYPSNSQHATLHQSSPSASLLPMYVSEQCLKRWCTPRPLCMLLVQAAMGCAHLLFSIGDPLFLYPAAALVGAAHGAHWTLMVTTASELFGLKHFGALYNTLR